MFKFVKNLDYVRSYDKHREDVRGGYTSAHEAPVISLSSRFTRVHLFSGLAAFALNASLDRLTIAVFKKDEGVISKARLEHVLCMTQISVTDWTTS